MKDFQCECGNRIFFFNNRCLSCERRLGFDPNLLIMRAFPKTDGWLRSDSGEDFNYCQNYYDFNACNWLVKKGSKNRYCLSCRLNKTVPDLVSAENINRWSKLEAAKRHLIYSLLSLGLPIQSDKHAPVRLAFAFLEDARTNPNYAESFVATGHSSGLITINLAEADDAYRERVKEELGEHYRTILGHFRHEIGHYYYEMLVARTSWRAPFEALFGNPQLDYQQALKAHYQQPQMENWQSAYISSYAQSHPLEDWAETWAHYLHILDTLDTAIHFKLVEPLQKNGRVDAGEAIEQWLALSVKLNALNRSMGLPDAYPFVITPKITEKLKLIHRVIEHQTTAMVATGQRLQ
ncbi:putative zinc-binding metallopeptidase [Gilvimarinus sp. SDUM040013]|uniref:Zinc-binding metallopeptidase n=1 Tax=Gilvimarinus gilvus TaxID=3058038 RepID=A0ABU4RY33_9GAMM|nr:putative zinc-binding metallopeptidase [Gilvimarinus sp. SDUM040013]MDO3386495.1 putative zinc-binding metallopeptidase [Gilvimarinus sp. SDUM040013]MDX6849071.1 putative zinc-binding metallopeptidase [Gilvimarinus sp. SDUM040013]